MSKVTIVIVTRNRLKLFQNCLQAVQAQTHTPDQIIVVDNGSTDGTIEWLEKQKSIKLIKQSNVGGAGGFYTGMKQAYDDGADWIWTMDDDGHPSPSALAELLKNGPQENCIKNSIIINSENKQALTFEIEQFKNLKDFQNQPVFISTPQAPLMNSTLIHRSVIDKIGLPNKKLFIAGDEIEYRLRATNVDKTIIVGIVPTSIHYHPAFDPEANNFNRDWPLNSLWKKYYMIRNQKIILHNYYYGKPIRFYLNYFKYCLGIVHKICFKQKSHAIKKAKVAITALTDGLFNNYSRSHEKVEKMCK